MSNLSEHVLKGGSCEECGKSWPCPTSALVTENTLLKAEVGDLREQLAVVKDWEALYYDLLAKTQRGAL